MGNVAIIPVARKIGKCYKIYIGIYILGNICHKVLFPTNTLQYIYWNIYD